VRALARIPRLRTVARRVRTLLPAPTPGGILAMAVIPAGTRHDVIWVPGALPAHAAMHERQEHEDRSRARIVLILSLACALLAIYDLILLASGG